MVGSPAETIRPMYIEFRRPFCMPEPNNSGFALHVSLPFVIWCCLDVTKVKPGSLLCRRNQLTADVYEVNCQ
eukprot:scaffold117608_cov18-Prasinocladus_malaysianus.AAC.1